MKFSKKMVLVDVDDVKHLHQINTANNKNVYEMKTNFPNQNELQSPDRKLDSEIFEILNNKKLSDTQKVQMYGYLLRKYMLLKTSSHLEREKDLQATSERISKKILDGIAGSPDITYDAVRKNKLKTSPEDTDGDYNWEDFELPPFISPTSDDISPGFMGFDKTEVESETAKLENIYKPLMTALRRPQRHRLTYTSDDDHRLSDEEVINNNIITPKRSNKCKNAIKGWTTRKGYQTRLAPKKHLHF